MWATVLQVETPACAWCRRATTHPDVGIRVLQYYAQPNGRSLEVVEMTGERWREVADDVRTLASVHEVEVLEEEAARGEVRINADECALPKAIEASGVVPQTPWDVAMGCDKMLLLSAKEHARTFVETLSKEGVKVTIAYSGEYTPAVDLTERQREVLNLALSYGYYDYPRRITLSHLADKAGVAKSTLSQTLMLIEREIMHRAAHA